MIKSFVFVNCPLSKFISYPLSGKTDRDPIFLKDGISKGQLPDPGERHSWVVEDLYLKGLRKYLPLQLF